MCVKSSAIWRSAGQNGYLKMVLCNILIRKLKMFNVMRNVCVIQSFPNRSLAGILSNRISDIISSEKLYYSKRSKEALEAPNPKNAANSDNTTTTTTAEKNSRKTAESSIKITLISKDSSVTVVSLEEARRLSKRRDLKLVKVVDNDHKTQRPVYKLMAGAEYFEEDLLRRKEKSSKKSNETKEPKLLTLKANIGDHDLESKIKNIIKWLNKRHEVRIMINCAGNEEAAELVCSKIETETKSCGRMVQKRKKGDDLKFHLLSLKKKDDDSSDKSTEESDAVEKQKDL